MARVKGAPASRRRKKKIIKQAKGFTGSRRRLYKTAKESVWRARQYAYIHRKQKKRNFRRLWIIRINAAARQNGISYSAFMNGMKELGIEIDRKVLADLSVNEPQAFSELVQRVRTTSSAAE